jgi:hypothetical protein
MRKPPFQQFFGGTEAGIDGTDGNIEDIRDLFERKILKIEQSYNDAVLLRQGQKGAAQVDAAVDILLVGGDGREKSLFFILSRNSSFVELYLLLHESLKLFTQIVNSHFLKSVPCLKRLYFSIALAHVS